MPYYHLTVTRAGICCLCVVICLCVQMCERKVNEWRMTLLMRLIGANVVKTCQGMKVGWRLQKIRGNSKLRTPRSSGYIDRIPSSQRISPSQERSPRTEASTRLWNACILSGESTRQRWSPLCARCCAQVASLGWEMTYCHLQISRSIEQDLKNTHARILQDSKRACVILWGMVQLIPGQHFFLCSTQSLSLQILQKKEEKKNQVFGMHWNYYHITHRTFPETKTIIYFILYIPLKGHQQKVRKLLTKNCPPCWVVSPSPFLVILRKDGENTGLFRMRDSGQRLMLQRPYGPQGSEGSRLSFVLEEAIIAAQRLDWARIVREISRGRSLPWNW